MQIVPGSSDAASNRDRLRVQTLDDTSSSPSYPSKGTSDDHNTALDIKTRSSRSIGSLEVESTTGSKHRDVFDHVQIRNVIVFGETGTGKSSLINMLAGTEVTKTSSNAHGCTFQSCSIEVSFDSGCQIFDSKNLKVDELVCHILDSKTYRFWDTSGLNEGEEGTVPAKAALSNLHELVAQLSEKENGISLLVYCIRGSRLRDIVRVNYDLFWGIICQRKVPIVLVVTGLELEEDMERWWVDNKEELKEMGMTFHGHACVTTTKGKNDRMGKPIFEKEFRESETRVRELVESTCASEPLRLQGERWMAQILRRLQEYMLHYNQRTGREREFTTAADSESQLESYRTYAQHLESLKKWARSFQVWLATLLWWEEAPLSGQLPASNSGGTSESDPRSGRRRSSKKTLTRTI
jgi:predicted GTPase